MIDQWIVAPRRRGAALSFLRLLCFGLLVGVSLAVAGCGKEYRCPDPIGPIVRDDCEDYRTRYESLKVSLGFSIGALGVSVAAGKEKLRHPSELLQLLMQQTLALCKDFNSCRLQPAGYRRRREAVDRKLTAVTAISQQLKGELDPASKQRLVTKLIEVLSDAPPQRAVTGGRRHRFGRRPVRFQPVKFQPGSFRGATRRWFGTRFLPPRPVMPKGVPVLASWQVTQSWMAYKTSTYAHLVFWGEAEADDRVFVSYSHSSLAGDAAVRPPRRKQDLRSRVSIKVEGEIEVHRGELVVDYWVGARGAKERVGRFALAPSVWLDRAYLAYLPDPVRRDPIAYERPWLVFYSQIKDRRDVTVRCHHNGRLVPGVLTGRRGGSTYTPTGLGRFHVPLPVRIPLAGGRERGKWSRPRPGEAPVIDRFADQAAGAWRCEAKIRGRLARRFSFRLTKKGAVVPTRKPDLGVWPWWPIGVERIENEIERQRATAVAAKRAKARQARKRAEAARDARQQRLRDAREANKRFWERRRRRKK